MLSIKFSAKEIIIFLVAISFSSCGIFRKGHKSNNAEDQTKDQKQINKVLNYAKSYYGTPYKLGGNDKNGIDCSGLVKNSFGTIGVELPRKSVDQQTAGKEIQLSNCAAGDLIFFNTSKNNSKQVNHVGIISRVEKNEIFFIHASTTKGVRENSLNEEFYKKAFVKIVRVV